MSFNFAVLLAGCMDLGTGSDGRKASVSWTVRICLAKASDRVNARSHSSTICQ